MSYCHHLTQAKAIKEDHSVNCQIYQQSMIQTTGDPKVPVIFINFECLLFNTNIEVFNTCVFSAVTHLGLSVLGQPVGRFALF
jgi:hypothetical protein